MLKYMLYIGRLDIIDAVYAKAFSLPEEERAKYLKGWRISYKPSNCLLLQDCASKSIEINPDN